ncbi:hypothetical protein IU404_02439 (plasmid) [Limosilactobacillus reuteri]|nr:hypothetical protein IU404_02439 [Limosilactobacillus reuteri]
MNSNLKKNLIIANGFLLLIIIFYVLLHMGPLNMKVLLVGLVLMNLTVIFK